VEAGGTAEMPESSTSADSATPAEGATFSDGSINADGPVETIDAARDSTALPTDSPSGSDATLDAANPLAGFACGAALHCAVIERCVSCQRSVTQYDLLCVPDPDRDPAGYADQTRDCQSARDFTDCDGPEDCKSGQFCIVDGVTPHCSDVPSPASCWACNLARGQFCHVDGDCPSGLICTDDIGFGSGIRGCQ
jgi:hypothetical protein